MTQRRSFSLATAGHALQGAGMFRAGHIVRAVSNANIGSDLGIAQLSLAIGAAGVALAGIAATAKLVQASFGMLEKSTTALVSSIARIGGARGLEDMMVESVSNEKLINQARFSVMSKERMTSSEMMSAAQGLSHNASAGAFTTNDWLKTIKGIGVETGIQSGLSKDTLEFIGQFANVGGMSVEQSGSIFSRIKKQNMSMSNQDIIRTMLAGHAIGQTGSFSIDELPDAAKLLQLEGKFGGEGSQRLQSLFTAGTLAKAGGAGNLTEAGTQLKAFLQQAKGNPNFKFGVNNELLNSQQAFDYLVSTPQSKMNKSLLTGRSRSFITEMQFATSQRAGVSDEDFSNEASKKRRDVIDEFMRLGMSMEEFQKEVDASISPQERFKAAFNRIADELEGKFLEVLKEIGKPGGVLDTFADRIVARKDEIGKYFEQLAVWLAVAVEKFPAFVHMMAGFSTAIGKAIIFILSHMPGSSFTSNIDQAKQNIINRQNEYNEALLHPESRDPAKNLAAIALRKQALEDAVLNVSVLQGQADLSPAAIQKSVETETEAQKQDRDSAKAKDDYNKTTAAKNALNPQTSSATSLPQSGADHLADLLKAIARSQEIANKHAAETAINTRKTPQAPSRSTNGN